MPIVITNLGLACYYILSKNTQAYFPFTNKAHPSQDVVIPRGRRGPLPGEAETRLPLIIKGDYWHRVVVPVLEKDIWHSRISSIDNFLAKSHVYETIRLIDLEIEQQARLEGFIP